MNLRLIPADRNERPRGLAVLTNPYKVIAYGVLEIPADASWEYDDDCCDPHTSMKPLRTDLRDTFKVGQREYLESRRAEWGNLTPHDIRCLRDIIADLADFASQQSKFGEDRSYEPIYELSD